MFQSLIKSDETVSIQFDGQILKVTKGISVAAALLSQGVNRFRTSVVGGEPRAPYCMMGVCFECLVTIDDVQNRQSCMTEVYDGMVVKSQQGARRIGSDTPL
ncbi:(2Fe-2S)-binding protein [Paenochrobactrum sp. BZR 588]|uniref:(2Fe-2S)-binding protein n=1 Tax=Paenochrobactrum TaxID=999488 RepID=UPI0035BC14D9